MIDLSIFHEYHSRCCWSLVHSKLETLIWLGNMHLHNHKPAFLVEGGKIGRTRGLKAGIRLVGRSSRASRSPEPERWAGWLSVLAALHAVYSQVFAAQAFCIMYVSLSHAIMTR